MRRRQKGDAFIGVIVFFAFTGSLMWLGYWVAEGAIVRAECKARGHSIGEFSDGRIRCWTPSKEVAPHD